MAVSRALSFNCVRKSPWPRHSRLNTSMLVPFSTAIRVSRSGFVLAKFIPVRLVAMVRNLAAFTASTTRAIPAAAGAREMFNGAPSDLF